MICAVLFDLDGTLVQTEELKARSYAEAARKLDPAVDEPAVVAEFSHLAGQSREAVARKLMTRFHLAGTWERFVELRLERYDAMLADADLLRRQALPAALALLARLRKSGVRTALTTMSDPEHARQILAALGLSAAFEAIITPADVAQGKPAPDMYQAVTARLRCAPAALRGPRGLGGGNHGGRDRRRAMYSGPDLGHARCGARRRAGAAGDDRG